jgi:hypothetical protein
MKPPDTDPPCVTQAVEVTKAAEEGLEKEHAVSVGRNPLPKTETCKPTRAVPGLRPITGDDSMFHRSTVPIEKKRMHVSSKARTDRKKVRNYTV